jgi:hypothetical protein
MPGDAAGSDEGQDVCLACLRVGMVMALMVVSLTTWIILSAWPSIRFFEGS